MTVETPPPKTSRSNAGRVVIPHRAGLKHRVLALAVASLLRGLAGSMRFRWEIDPETAELEPPVIFAVWHNRLALSMAMYRGYVRRQGAPQRLAALVSASRDGAFLARVLELFRTQPVRGSSSRRGSQALLELTTWAEKGYDLAITPDGPRGPCYTVQEGTIALAQVTGLPIVPVGTHFPAKVRLKSWDRFKSRCPSAAVF